MTRFAFNVTCSVLFIAIMTGIAWLLRQASVDFVDGCAVGTGVTLSLLWACHKMGCRIF